MTITGILVLWIMCVMFPQALVGLLEGIWCATCFAGLVLLKAGEALAQLIWCAVSYILRHGWRCACLGASFLYYLAAELRGGARDDDDYSADAADDHDELYQAALTLLRLPGEYTQAALDAAYKAAIRKAHPDAGGSVDEAQSINTARDLLLRRLRSA